MNKRQPLSYRHRRQHLVWNWKKTDIQRPTSLEPAKFAEAQPVGQHGWRTGGALGQYKNPGLNRCQMWFPFLHPAEWLFIPPNSLDWVSSRPTIQSKNRFWTRAQTETTAVLSSNQTHQTQKEPMGKYLKEKGAWGEEELSERGRYNQECWGNDGIHIKPKSENIKGHTKGPWTTVCVTINSDFGFPVNVTTFRVSLSLFPPGILKY